MYIGHFAVAFAAKRVAPKASLGVLLAAAMFIDLIWPVFLLLGWERVRIDPGNTAFTPLDFVSYPYSHSLAMTLLWALVFGYGYEANAQYRTGALVSITASGVRRTVTSSRSSAGAVVFDAGGAAFGGGAIADESAGAGRNALCFASGGAGFAVFSSGDAAGCATEEELCGAVAREAAA